MIDYKKILEQHREVDIKTGCWNWTGYLKHGYGSLCITKDKPTDSKLPMYVHRLSMSIYRGFDVYSSLFICHKCDNSKCFNPNHLFVGTQEDNMRDRDRKGRQFNQKKTHCPKNHEYTKENTYTSGGSRKCKICVNQRQLIYENRKRNA